MYAVKPSETNDEYVVVLHEIMNDFNLNLDLNIYALSVFFYVGNIVEFIFVFKNIMAEMERYTLIPKWSCFLYFASVKD